MTTVDLTLDDEILSTHETAPKAPKEPPVNPASAQCHYCTDTFEGAARWFNRGRHEKSKHEAEWKANRVPGAKKATRAKKAAKRVAAAKKTPVAGVGKKRVSAANALSDNIGRAARMFGTINPAMGRALVFSAPATGQAIDEVVAGTIVDRVVQPFAKAADKWDQLGGVLSFPILFAIVSARPDMMKVLEPDLRESVIDVLIGSIPTLIKQKEREAKAFDALEKLGEVDARYANAKDKVGLLLQDLLYGLPEVRGEADEQ